MRRSPFGSVIAERSRIRAPRIGWSGDLGFLPVEREVLEICAKAMGALEALGPEVTGTAPDFRGAMAAFQT
jgi:Asp-tRNA(Asn)/Glu-tRNA(Gln) amidotransferase A subunit family amidase